MLLFRIWGCWWCYWCYADDGLVWGGVGWGMLTFLWTCWSSWCYADDGVGWGGVGHVNVVCSDEAKCYPGLTASHKLIHYACSHRKNQFVKKLKRHAGKTLWVHTGTIDSCWGMMKDSVPDQLPTCKNDQSKLNDLIWTYVRAWQWRWQSHVHGQALLKKTGSYLAQM